MLAPVDRREALKKATAAGAIAWVAPTLGSSRAFAQDGTCTPKCIPVGTPTYTALTPVATCAATYNVTVAVVSSPGTVTCPCGGEPTLENATVSRSFPRRFRGVADLTGDVSLVCTDLAGDSCPVTCTVTVTINITGNNGNDCARNQATVVSVQTAC